MGTAALNPAFASSAPRRLPFACGYVLGSGDQFLDTTTVNGQQFRLYLLGECEWDGVEMTNTFPSAASGTNPTVPSHMFRQSLSMRTPTQWADETSQVMHFHTGKYTPTGASIPIVDPTTGLIPKNSSQDVGSTQGYDPWFSQFPSVTPPQSFSGIAYVIFGLPNARVIPRGSFITSTIAGMCVYRTSRCRIFDGNGNVIAYQFTCNPAWHKVEAILRFKIKPQQPPCAGLTDAEKACFNWDAIATLAARNDHILPNGNPRFIGNYIFAANSSLASILETMYRVDRSFGRVDDGKITMIGDDARASVFIASAKHLVPGSLNLNKKDVSKAPNLFVPKYRDLEIPAVARIQSAISYGAFFLSGREIAGFRAFTCATPSPFQNFGYMTAGGCKKGGVAHPGWDGDYEVFVPDETNDPYPRGSDHPNVTYAMMPTAPGTPLDTIDDGYLGTNDARFSERAPTGVQHRSAQKMVAMQAPGVAVLPRVKRVEYDCGNSTFDQTNRLMKSERDKQLGTDTGASWRAPIAGSLSLYLEVVDENGVALLDVVKSHEVITLDDWLFPEGPGDYEIGEVDIATATEDDPGHVELTLHEYNRNAPTDVSDPPGNQYPSVPNSDLKYIGFSLPIGDAGAFVLKATLGVAHVGGTLTITIPDLLIHWPGNAAPTAYPGFSVAGIPINSPVCLYVLDAARNGVAPAFGFIAGLIMFSETFGGSTWDAAALIARGSFVVP